MNNYIFSLIVATYGRIGEIERFLRSIQEQDFDLAKVEVIIVDQNDVIDLSDIIGKYVSYFRILHIKTGVKGTSHGRNLGIDAAQGDIIAFPDDDCTYYSDTLKQVQKIFKDCSGIDCMSGRIYDREKQENILRDWGKIPHYITWKNFYYNSSAITKFVRGDIACRHRFCESLGPGTTFGSCEDPDYIVGLLRESCKIFYTPNIEVWHPKETIDELSESKIERYGIGFGGFCRKNLNLYIFLLFASAIIFHGVHYLTDTSANKRKRISYIRSRFRGWCMWSKKEHGTRS